MANAGEGSKLALSKETLQRKRSILNGASPLPLGPRCRLTLEEQDEGGANQGTMLIS